MNYLQDEQHYIDIYDLHTIEKCLDYYWSIKDGFKKDRKKFKDYTDEKFDTEVHKITSYTINVIKGERYRHKATKIKEWMDRDRVEQEKFDNAEPPHGILCKVCHSPTEVTSKDLMDSYSENSKVLFMFECVKCKKRQARYEDGKEWHYQAPLCPKCNSSLENDSVHKKDLIITTYKCPECDYKKKDIHDFEKSRKEREAKEARDRKLLAEYRDQFCLNEKDGPEYLLSMDRISAFVKEMKEKEVKEKDPVFKQAMKLKKLSIVELEKLLTPVLEENKYIRLSFSNPTIEKNVVVPFTVQDANTKRNERESVYDLKRLIKKTIEGTNWRLTSEGASYRLGFLRGNLKGYESEDDLISIVKSTQSKRL